MASSQLKKARTSYIGDCHSDCHVDYGHNRSSKIRQTSRQAKENKKTSANSSSAAFEFKLDADYTQQSFNRLKQAEENYRHATVGNTTFQSQTPNCRFQEIALSATLGTQSTHFANYWQSVHWFWTGQSEKSQRNQSPSNARHGLTESTRK